MQILEPIFVTCKQTIASVHFKFTLGHLLGLFDLVLRKLDSRGGIVLLLLLTGSLSLLILLSLLLLLSVRRLFGAGLLSNLAFHQVNRVFLQFLPDLLFFPFPLIFKSMCTVSLVFRNNIDGLLFAILGHELQVEEGIVKHLKVSHLL